MDARSDRVPAKGARKRNARSVLLAASLLTFAALAPALASDAAHGGLRVEHPYARPTPPGARTGAAYFTIENDGTQSDRLVRVTSPVCQSAALHEMRMQGNLMKMREIAGLDVPAGKKVELATGGHHVMLMGLRKPLKVGDTVPLALTFEKAGTIDVAAKVEAAATGPHPGASQTP